ncbi:MAG: Fic family protein [Demequinaceae bacterium]|nr:Fic family protein [Demequinaceae bacterium]
MRRRRVLTTQLLSPHGGESLEWKVPGGGTFATRAYTASVPPALAQVDIVVTPATADECSRVGLELAVFSRTYAGKTPGSSAAAATLVRAESLASSLIDGHRTASFELARCEALLPSTRDAREVRTAVEALRSHLAAADRALGLGAIAAAHTPPLSAPAGRRVARYRTVQTWLGGTDLWPTGAAYVPPRALHVPALMDDLVEFCARTDVDPMIQAAVAHAQLLSIQPFPDANGRAARALINGVWRRRGVAGAVPVPISAALARDRRHYDSALMAYRDGNADPIVALVARHALRAVKEATASAGRMALMPGVWADAARPRRGSATHALLSVLAAHPIVTAAEVTRLTGASQASAYDAIARLSQAGVLRRLSLSRRNSVWVAGDIIDEADRVVTGLAGGPLRGERGRDGAARRHGMSLPTDAP